MTNDDREEARHTEGDPSEPRRGKPSPGLGPRLGGLLDGLPESGKGAQGAPSVPAPQGEEPRSVPGNPFRRPLQEPAAPTRQVRPANPPAPPAPPGNVTPEPEPEPAPEPEPEAAPEPEPEPVSTRAPVTARDPRPNVIPFRGGPHPAARPQEPLAPEADPPGGEPAQEPTPAQGSTESDAATNTGHVDQVPAAAEPAEQSDTVHAHEAAASFSEPQHTGPPRVGEPAGDVRGRPAPAPEAPADDAWRHTGHDFDDAERAAVYRAIRERRDVRAGFRPDPIPAEVLTRVLEAAHQAPSIGHTQPWDFLVIDDTELRARVRDLAEQERDSHSGDRPGARAHAFSGLKVEAILDSPLNIAVTVDPTRGAQAPGRHAKPASYSAALAVENLWLAARAEGLGVGWVGITDERGVADVLALPSHLEVVAYLCVGYVDEFPTEPELGLSGWVKGRPLSWAVHRDRYGHRGLPGQEPTTLLEETITAIGALNARAVEEARDRQARMTKPLGSLGVLEDVSVRLAGLAGECPPPIPEPAAVAVFAGDHGVYAQGVTAWPQEVTAQMVQNFIDGGAVVNAFAEQVGAEVTVVDVGVVGDLPPAAGLLPRKVARGTADFTQGPAMSREQALQALEGGIEVARDLVSAGNRCLITGDMGIGNTTPAAALVCAFTGADPAEATGRGTGVDDATYEHKVEVVRKALAANPVDSEDPIGTLAALGGLEHAALAGFILGASALRIPVLLDGVIAGSAALAAAAISPESLSACFAGHRSTEPGHGVVLHHLGLTPLVDLEMRLGEGSGALLALPLLQGSARALRTVATFDSAGVSTDR
ncbi:nicotinate-nucleotide--dimethylbenzimidazole phosphoribosyltransferase [Nocardiopsis listeri]|uniref:nicotinate-nucleotide--dimethylbenzimidazole phosphoribosyltransferase n=1 Tax=Nocardiopsis listeri TaxID=53440 RepID=UPI00082C1BA2|nr:nicotinate-nucleotide--dimethylbenzimidazole phosphoribosyltransferase [Nocardiopsis listeri]